MKHFIISLVAVVFTFGFFVPEAEARRFGGGGSFGMQRQMSPPPAPRAAQAPAPRPPQAAGAPTRSWLGPVAGLAAGLGLAALFSHLGLGEEFGSLLLIALMIFAAVMLFRMLSRRATASTEGANRVQFAGSAAGSGRAPQQPRPSFGGLPAAAPVDEPVSALRADFDEEGFVRQAKLNFIRLQAANDEGNLADIREFTTPEVFAEIRMQLADTPADGSQHTDVVDLDAQVLEVEEDDDRYIVSVRFDGLLREDAGAAPAAFDEIWHLTKDKAGRRGWLVAGIQQTV